MFLHIGRDPELSNSGPCSAHACRSALLAICIAVTSLSAAHAQSDIPLTLTEAEDLALAAEPGQLALEARAAALDERAVAAVEQD